MTKDEKGFSKLVESWKNQGYQVHVTQGFLESLEELEKPYIFSFWDLVPIPFEIAEDVLGTLPRNRVTRWLLSWMATLAIMANRPLHKKLVRRMAKTRSYRIA